MQSSVIQFYFIEVNVWEIQFSIQKLSREELGEEDHYPPEQAEFLRLFCSLNLLAPAVVLFLVRNSCAGNSDCLETKLRGGSFL